MESDRDYKEMLKEEKKCTCEEFKADNPGSDSECAAPDECCEKEDCCGEDAADCYEKESCGVMPSFMYDDGIKEQTRIRDPNFVFKDQTKEQAKKAMKEAGMQKRMHSSSCKCHTCMLREIGKPGKPEYFVSKDQTLDQVKELLSKSSKCGSFFKNVENPPGVEIEDFLEEDSDFVKSIKDCYKKYDACAQKSKKVGLSGCDYTLANWRKLAGVKAQKREVFAKEENKSLADELMECVLSKVRRKLPDLNVSWSDDWERYLSINDARTNVKLPEVAVLYENLLHFISKEEAKDMIGDIMLKKLSSLFI